MRTAAFILILALAPCAAAQDSGADPYRGLITSVQERLAQLGFAPGPVNGDFGAETQAALAQFQLSLLIPASGQLDDQTLAALGVTRDSPPASAGASLPDPTQDRQPALRP